MVLAATDTGLGMDEATRARIFEPFFTTKPPGQGTGLGLSTVYGILQQSGGGIEVESTLDQGTTFRVYLPMAADTSEAAPPPSRPTPRVGELQGTVLVAEDEESVRMLVRTVLSGAGFRVFEAASGTEAARMVQGARGTDRSAHHRRRDAWDDRTRSRAPRPRSLSANARPLHHRLRDALRRPARVSSATTRC